jgi:hypothetical protein
MGKAESAERPDGVGEERLGSVERADVAELGGKLGPAGGLDCSAGFESEIVKVGLPFVGEESPFAE